MIRDAMINIILTIIRHNVKGMLPLYVDVMMIAVIVGSEATPRSSSPSSSSSS